MDVPNYTRFCQGQQIVVALEIALPVAETIAAIVIFTKPETLDHRAHRTIQNQDSILERGQQRIDSFLSVHRAASGCRLLRAHAECMTDRKRQFRAIQRIEVKFADALCLKSLNLLNRDAGGNHLPRFGIVFESCEAPA